MKMKLRERKFLSGLFITAIIILTIASIPPAQSVNVTLELDKGSYAQGDTIFCTLTIDIDVGERIPIDNIQLIIDGPAQGLIVLSPSGAVISSDMDVTLVSGPQLPLPYGYGYLFGYDGQTGYGYEFGYGYGYGTSTLTYVLQINTGDSPAGTYSARVEVNTGNINHPIFSSDSIYFEIVSAVADIAITKTDSPDPVTVGKTLTYTITVTSNGPATAKNVMLTDTTPTILLNPQYSLNGGTTWNIWTGSLNIGDMASGSSTQILIRGTISTTYTGSSVSNTATVSTTTPESNTANNSATATTVVQPPPKPTPAPGGAVGPGAPVGPTPSEVEQNPEAYAPTLAAMSPGAAATILNQVSARAAEIVLDSMSAQDAAEIMNLMDPAKVAAVLDIKPPEEAADRVALMDPAQAAIVLSKMADLGYADSAAEILTHLSLEKASELLVQMVRLHYASQAAKILEYMPIDKLIEILRMLSVNDRGAIIGYFSSETIDKLPLEFLIKAEKTEFVTIEAGETLVIDHSGITGVKVEITAKSRVSGEVTTRLFVANLHRDAGRPDYLDLRKFVEVVTTIPSAQIEQIRITIYYNDAEMYRMLEDTMMIYRYDPASNAWAPLETILDQANNNAATMLPSLSHFAVGGIDP